LKGADGSAEDSRVVTLATMVPTADLPVLYMINDT
jgi:hypothetical protein